jgi:hypothetical protein
MSFSLSCPSSVRPNVCGCNVLVQTARSPIGNMFSKDPCVWWSYMSVTKGGASTWGKRECPARHFIWAWYQEFIGIRPEVLPIQFWGVFPRHDPRAIMAKVAMLRFKEKPSTNWWFPIDGFDYHGLPSGPSPQGPFMLNILNPPTTEPWFLVLVLGSMICSPWGQGGRPHGAYSSCSSHWTELRMDFASLPPLANQGSHALPSQKLRVVCAQL